MIFLIFLIDFVLYYKIFGLVIYYFLIIFGIEINLGLKDELYERKRFRKLGVCYKIYLNFSELFEKVLKIFK